MFDPVVGGAVAVFAQGFFVDRFLAIKLCALPENFADAKHLRAVRVFFGFAFGVVFAVDRGPGFGGHAGGQPQPKPKEMRGQPMQIQ